MRDREPGDLILGLKISGRADGSGAAIGWALLREPGHKGEHSQGTRRVAGDSAGEALRLARNKGATEVSLKRYLNPGALSRSEHAGDMTMEEHAALVERTRGLLEENGIRVTIEKIA